VEVAAGGRAVIPFEVALDQPGEAAWGWSARPADDGLPADAADAVESRFPVYHPMPVYRQAAFARIDDRSGARDLLQPFERGLLDGEGQVEVEFSLSRLAEASEAVGHVLSYPYGCVEQTTSSLMPWFAVKDLRDAVPALRKSDDEIAVAVGKGVERLLSMQTADGGLAYWPGGEEPVEWGSVYGGLGLALAKASGHAVPAEAMGRLTAYLKGLLAPRAEGGTLPVEERARLHYTLAVAGAGDRAGINAVLEGKEKPGAVARIYLALALAEMGDRAAAKRWLEVASGGGEETGYPFLRQSLQPALALYAWCQVDPSAPAVEQGLDRLLARRNRAGHWVSTIGNAWGLRAMAAYARAVERPRDRAVIRCSGSFAGPIELGRGGASRAVRFALRELRESGGLSARAEVGAAFCKMTLVARPAVGLAAAVDAGFSVRRSYARVMPDGSRGAMEGLAPGDLVEVTLEGNIRESAQYLALEDHLPALFEAVNPALAGDIPRAVELAGESGEFASHAEYRDERVAFFADACERGPFKVGYLARVTGEGSATAAPARIEAMYDPERHGLSATERVQVGK
jgi:uncharacterized protein YfaS (alpha-2-macroglobulin family)